MCDNDGSIDARLIYEGFSVVRNLESIISLPRSNSTDCTVSSGAATEESKSYPAPVDRIILASSLLTFRLILRLVL